MFESKGAFDDFVSSELFAAVYSHPAVKRLTPMDFSIKSSTTAIAHEHEKEGGEKQ